MLTDRELSVLLDIHRGTTIRDIASSFDVAIGTVQKALSKLESEGYVNNPYDSSTKTGRKAKGRKLTEKGYQELKKCRLLK